MTKTEVIPGFKCVEFKNRAQSEIYEEIKDMTHEEAIAYFRHSAETGLFAAWWKALRARDNSVDPQRKV